MRIARPRAASLIVSLAAAAVTVSAQAPGPVLAPTLPFEVASVKVNREGQRAPMQWLPGGRFRMGLPIQSLVTIGYQVPVYRIDGLPDWTSRTFFDIDARAERQPAIEERPAYYRGLLEDRFGLRAHVEERDMPAYALVLAREDRRLGPGLRRTEVNCEAAIAESRRRAEAGERPAPPAPGVRPTCGAIGGAANLTAGAVEIASLVGLLSSGLERPVVDRTGLAGRFDIDFRSAPLRLGGPAAPPTDLPSVFTAVQEQLGLKLEPVTARVPVLVIDRLEMPSEN